VSYKSANGVLDYRLLLGKNKILSITDLEGRITTENFMNAEWGNTFSLRIKTDSLTEVNLFIEEMIHHLKLSFHSMDASYFQIQKVILVLMNAVSELDEAEFQVLTNSKSVNMLNEVYRYQTLDDIEQWLKEICKKVLVYVSQKRKTSTNQLMERATKYIQDNFADQELSLQELSRYVHVSGNYLSTLFKQYTGDTFIEYLTRIRIEKAKEFMIQTDLKFYEIAPLVGCADPNYFSVVFKKNTGATPKEYREKWLKGITE
jgi:two-component system response regulator YesN